ncbi:MAG: hypothetical protein MUP11_03310, partial [Anaerolineales bacterium]|nr:hypothetical protein [Anaerolineales bacterium]
GHMALNHTCLPIPAPALFAHREDVLLSTGWQWYYNLPENIVKTNNPEKEKGYANRTGRDGQ